MISVIETSRVLNRFFLLTKAIKFGHCEVDVVFVSSPLDKTSSHLKKQKKKKKSRKSKKKTQDFRTGAGEGLCLEAERF